MKTLFLILAVLFLSSCAGKWGADWSQADTNRQIGYTVLHMADWSQTRYIARHPKEYHEVNPVLGRHPSVGKVNTYFAVTGLANIWVSGALSPKYRKWWQYFCIGFEGGVVAHNASIGIKFDF